MSRGYRELVGLQVTFDKTVHQYRLEHYYRWSKDRERSPVLVMRGYDMDYTEKQEDILASFRYAYAPVILTVWHQDVVLSESQFLQFEVGARPDEIGLGGDWAIVAEM
jgi:hypothetical protein